MNDYSKAFLHLKKTESLIKKKINLDNVLCELTNQKMQNKIKKIKKNKDNKINDSSMKKVNYIKKISAKKRANTHIDKCKNNYTNNDEIKNMTKLTNNKSFNNGKNKRIRKIKINNNKIIKRINDNSRNYKSFFDNYEKNKKRKKNILNKKHTYKATISSNITQINDPKFENTYFKTIFNTREENKKNEDNYYSFSQNFGNKKNNILRKINTNIPLNNDKYKKKELIIDRHVYNRSQSNFYSNKTNNALYSNYLINIDDSNIINNKPNANINKKKEETINNYKFISKNDNNNENKNIQTKQRQLIKLYNDDNNTSINIDDSFNYHQYFNTIINNKIKNNINRNKKTNLINRNYNKNKLTIDNYNNKIYNNINYFQTQISSNNNDNDNKNKNFFINEKFINEINKINKEMEKNLVQKVKNIIY